MCFIGWHSRHSENSVVVGVPISRLLQVLLNVDWLRHLDGFIVGTLLS